MPRIITSILVCALLAAAAPPRAAAQSSNLLRNPGFESGTSSWTFFTNGTGSFASVSPGFTGTRSGRVIVTTTGSNIQLYQSALALEPSTGYTIRFTAYSSTGRDVSLSVLKQSSPFTNYGLSGRVVNLTTGWQRFTIQFTTSGFSSNVTDGRLRFWFAGLAVAGETYLFDDVEIVKTSTAPLVPAITREPLDARAAIGQTASFSVTAIGTAPLAYQWQKNGAPVPGATGAVYSTPAVGQSDSGAGFRCIVTNSLGADTSITAILSVLPPLTMTFWDGRDQRFGHIGDPVPAVNLLGNVFARNGLRTFGYSLNGAAEVALSRGPDSRRLQEAGDFNADIPVSRLTAGLNRVVFRAVDSSGATRRDTVRLTYTAGNTWPLPWSASWSALSSPADGGQVLDGRWRIENGALRTSQVGYDRLVAMGETSWQDYEVTVPVTIHRVNPAGYEPPNNGPAVGVILRWPGHSDLPSSVAGRQPKTGYLPLGALAWYSYETGGEHLEIIGNNLQVLARETSGRRLEQGVRYLFKARVETIAGTGPRYSLKVWPAAGAEPAGWDLTGQEEPTDPQNGCLLLVAHHVDASFGDVFIRPLGTVTYPLAVTVSGAGTVTRAPDLAAYDQGQSVTLTAVPAGGWVFQGWSGDLTGAANPAVVVMNGPRTVTALFTPSGTPPDLAGDEFNATVLDTGLWTFVNPLGDASVSLDGSELVMSVPGGPAHDIWTAGAQAPRIMQTLANGDFTAEMKFTAPLGAKYQIQGLLAEQDAANFIRFDFVRDGTRTRAFAATFTGGVPTVRKDTAIAASTPLYLRVERTGSTWRHRFSLNGSTWVTAAVFTHPLVLNRAGVYFGNAGSPAPAFTGRIDYIRSFTTVNLTEEPLERPDTREMPERFALNQNYPNPFNPSTTLTYALPAGPAGAAPVPVRLEVYDLLGRRVAVLVNEPLPPGRYSVVFDGAGRASGTYLVRLTAGTQAATRTILLLR